MLTFLRNVGRRLAEWCLPFVVGFTLTTAVRPAVGVSSCVASELEARAS